ncbi:helix-turn-helix transcriptional regulator [Acidiphilium iwatense]|uniref:Helix-turn-helix transcriptional regulator n=1 Tax=Acidiphilium iwatense TaxID=768198 RepID=A0ABS9E4T2_9PROT|nr:helix-turn-helix transcriptional regulator [Acidiphilium iwatense]MCF3948584.1 helix-turn-helix transcriptional regulator [Acidiphilium iwatense]
MAEAQQRPVVSAPAAPDLGTIAAVVGQIGTPALPLALDGLLRTVTAFDLSVIFGYPYGEGPRLLHDGYGAHATRAALDAYLRGAYLLDPFYTASVQGHPPGLWRMSELAPDHFFQSDFYGASDVHPCISLEPGSLVEEIGFLVPLPCGFTAAYSLMRKTGRSAFSESEMDRLRALEPIVREVVRSQWRQLDSAAPAAALDGALEAAFTRFAQDDLTYQQRRIVQLILRGHSTLSISTIIGTTEGTVKIHRKNIYRRLGISSQSELFGRFIKSPFAIDPM